MGRGSWVSGWGVGDTPVDGPPGNSAFCPSPVLEILRNGLSLPVLEGQSLCLVCVAYSNPPASVSWAWVTQTMIPTQSSESGVLELPLVQREHEGEFTCAAQNRLGTQRISLSLSVHCEWGKEHRGSVMRTQLLTLLLLLHRPAPDVQTLLLLGG